MLRTERRTAVMTIGSDVLRVCEAGCRDYCLDELGVTSSRSPTGSERVVLSWNLKAYTVSWKRCPASALPCDQCGNEWESRVNLGVYPPPETQPVSDHSSILTTERAVGVSW